MQAADNQQLLSKSKMGQDTCAGLQVFRFRRIIRHFVEVSIRGLLLCE